MALRLTSSLLKSSNGQALQQVNLVSNKLFIDLLLMKCEENHLKN